MRYVTRSRSDESTSNLNRHVRSCDEKRVPSEQSIADFAHGSTYTKSEFRYLVSLWVMQCHRPFAIIEDPPLLRMLRMLYAKVDVPSATTVSRDVKEIFRISKVNVGKFLQVGLSFNISLLFSNVVQSFSGKLHIGVDGWTSPNVFAFLGILVHGEKEGKLFSLILDFIRYVLLFLLHSIQLTICV